MTMADITNAQLEELSKEFKRFTDITSAANKKLGDDYSKFDTSTKAVVTQFNNLVKELSKLPTNIGKTIADEVKKVSDQTTKSSGKVDNKAANTVNETVAKISTANKSLDSFSKSLTAISTVIDNLIKKTATSNTKTSTKPSDDLTTSSKKSKGSLVDLGTIVDQTTKRLIVATTNIDAFTESVKRASTTIDSIVKSKPVTTSQPVTKTPRKEEKPVDNKKSIGAIDELTTSIRGTTTTLDTANKSLDAFSSGVTRAVGSIDKLVGETNVAKPRKEEKPVDNKKSIGAIDELTTSIRGTTTTLDTANKSLDAFSSTINRTVDAITKLVGETTVTTSKRKNKKTVVPPTNTTPTGALNELVTSVNTTKTSIDDVNKSLDIFSTTLTDTIKKLGASDITATATTPIPSLQSLQSSINPTNANNITGQSPVNDTNTELKLSKDTLRAFSTQLERATKIITRLLRTLPTSHQTGTGTATTGEQHGDISTNPIVVQLQREIEILRNDQSRRKNKKLSDTDNRKKTRPSQTMKQEAGESYESFSKRKSTQEDRERILEKGMGNIGKQLGSFTSILRSIIPMKSTGYGANIGKALEPLGKWITEKMMPRTEEGKGGVVGTLITAFQKFGFVFKTVGVVVGTFAAILTKWVGSAIKHNEAMNASYETLSKFGAIDSTGIQKLVQTVHSAGFTVDQLDKFGAILERERSNLALFGGTVASGARQVSSLFGSTLRTELESTYHALGYTTEEAFDVYSQYVGLMSKYGKVEGRRQSDLAMGANNLIKEMDLLSKVTGVSRKEQMESMQSRSADMGFVAFRKTLDDKIGGNVDLILNAVEGAFGPEFAKGLRHLLQTGGAATTEESIKVLRDLGRGSHTIIRGILDGSLNQMTTMKQISAATKPMAEMVANMSGTMGVQTSTFSTLNQKAVESIEKFINLSPDELKKLYADQALQISMANDVQRESELQRVRLSRALNQTLDELNQSMGVFVSKQLPMLFDAFNTLAKGIANILNKFTFGLADIDLSKFDTREDLSAKITQKETEVNAYNSWLTLAEEHKKLKDAVKNAPESEKQKSQEKLKAFEERSKPAMQHESWQRYFGTSDASLVAGIARLKNITQPLDKELMELKQRQIAYTGGRSSDINLSQADIVKRGQLEEEQKSAINRVNIASQKSIDATTMAMDPVNTLVAKLRDLKIDETKIQTLVDAQKKPEEFNKIAVDLLKQSGIGGSFDDFKNVLRDRKKDADLQATEAKNKLKDIEAQLTQINTNTKPLKDGGITPSGEATMQRSVGASPPVAQPTLNTPPQPTRRQSPPPPILPANFTPSNRINYNTENYKQVAGDNPATDYFKRFGLGKSESPSYRAYNTGGNRWIKPKAYELTGDITYGEYRARAALPLSKEGNNGRIAAFGRYQLMPDSLATIATKNPKLLNDDTVLDAATQEVLFKEYLKTRKSPLYDILFGSKKVTREQLDAGVLDAAKAWAAVGIPYSIGTLRKGQSYYDDTGINNASVNPDELRRHLEEGLKKEGRLAKNGGIFSGPESGFPVLLHGNEAVIPLDNPNKKLIDDNVKKQPLDKLQTPEPTPVKTTVDNTYSANNQLYVLMEKMVTTIDDKLSDILIQLSRSKSIQEQQLQHMRH